MTHASPTPGKEHQDRFCHRAKAGFDRAGWLVCLLGWLIGFGQVGYAQSSMSEYHVKALFLFNFAKYIEWPAEVPSRETVQASITIGILGTSPLGQHLQKAVQGKTVSGRAVIIKQVQNPEEMGQCQILFIGSSEKSRLGEILGRLKSLPVLTVGETDQFARQGGIIGFVKKEGKVRLEIDLASARQARLEISSKLLSVADTVFGKN